MNDSAAGIDLSVRTCMSLYALGASFGQRSVPPRDEVACFARRRLLGDGRFTGDLDCLNMIRVRSETVDDLLDEVLGEDRCVWVYGAALHGRFVTYTPRVRQWTEVDLEASLMRKERLAIEGGFGEAWSRVDRRVSHTLPVDEVPEGAVVMLEGAGATVGWDVLLTWLDGLVQVAGVHVIADLPVHKEARHVRLCRASLARRGWGMDAEYCFSEREPLIVAGGIEIASGMPPFRVVRLKAL